ncbi:HIT domain-containing protein [soil metagenome]
MSTPLWAPWRMEYLLGQSPKAGCFLCEHPNDETRLRENLVVLVQPHAFVCLNRYPFAASHLLVAPRRHVAKLEHLEAEEYAALMGLLRDTTVRLERAVSCGGMNVGFNLGKVAGAGVADHLHGHVVPRWAGDTNFMPVLADVRVMPEHLDASWRRLYPAFADLPGVRASAPEAE